MTTCDHISQSIHESQKHEDIENTVSKMSVIGKLTSVVDGSESVHDIPLLSETSCTACRLTQALPTYGRKI
jgi:hypothetical protein